MLLTEPTFLFLFLPLLFVLYFPFATVATPDWWASGPANLNKANAVLLGAGAVFLAKGAGALVWLPIGLAAFNCWIAVALDRARAGEGARVVPSIRPRTVLALGVAANLLVLVAVRFRPLFEAQAGVLALAISRQPTVSTRALVSISVSIIALHGISYLVDIYRGDAEVQEGAVPSAVYLLFFPFLLAGPVMRYRDVETELTRRAAALGGFAFGVRRFVIGLCMKLLVADTLAIGADAIFALPPGQLTASRAWLGIACYTLQVYFALSGYSEMAIGLGRILGFRPLENFGWPYMAETVEAFWRDWNISLSGWFREYVYGALGGQAGPRLRRYGAFVAACLLFGLWHGAAWTFVAWGAYHATFLALERFGLAALVKRLPAALRHAYLLAVVAVGWVFFRAGTLSSALVFLKAMAGLNVVATPALALRPFITPELLLALLAGAVGAAPLTSMLGRWRVAIDAATISALGLLFTTALFTWRLLLSLRSFVFDIDTRK